MAKLADTNFADWTDAEGCSPEGFSMEKYEPMSRLLAEDDIKFLIAQPGYDAKMGAKFRRERRRIFRMYLREMAQDFRILHSQARAIVAESPAEYSELVGVLMKQQVTFWRARAVIEAKLTIAQLTPLSNLGTVDVRGLLGSMEAMRLDLNRLLAAGQAA